MPYLQYFSEWSYLSKHVDPYVLLFIPGLLASVLIAIFPILRRPLPMLVVVLVFGAVGATTRFPSIVAQVFVLWAVLRQLGRVVAANRALRWKYALMLLAADAALYFLAAWRFPSGIHYTAFGIAWVVYGTHAWCFLRQVCLIWEFGAGRVTGVALLPFFHWMFFPPAFVGTLWRYSDFQKQYPLLCSSGARPQLPDHWWKLGLLAVGEITVGTLLGKVLGFFFDPVRNRSFLTKVVASLAFYEWRIYFLGAGLTNLMRTCARFWNVGLPVSFDKPLGRTNISELWLHWNMTATLFFRDALFYNRWGMKRLNPYLNSFAVFVFMGLWHGSRPEWLVYGLLHGFGFACFLWWRDHPRLSGFTARLGIPKPLARCGAAVFTFVYFSSVDLILEKLAFVAGPRDI